MRTVGEARGGSARVRVADIPSPCVAVCRIRDDGFCDGCLRTTGEIAAWPSMSREDRIRLLEILDFRRRRAV
ncbi:MAG: DUF1289 domain-containing protein [Gammaproteobacteria bacterium]